MNQLQRVFNYQGAQIRTVTKDGEIWFVAKDVCDALGILDARKSVNLLDEDERNSIPVIDSLGRNQETLIINEPGLYVLILKSRKP
jgi:prophage antirepressor-like protein